MENYIITKDQANKILNTLLEIQVPARYTIDCIDILRSLKPAEETTQKGK